MGSFSTSSESEIRTILDRACGGQELLILATPYLRFESNILAVDEEALHARITMGAEESMYGLRAPELQLRFVDGSRFLQGGTRLLGFGNLSDKRTLRLAIPRELQDANHRSAYRVTRVPRVPVTFSTPKFELRTAQLGNLSTGGAGLTVSLGPADSPLKAGDSVAVSIPLQEEIHIDNPAVVRWVQGRSLGLEFIPALKGDVLLPLSRWMFRKREEEELRGSDRVVASPSGPGPVVFVSSSGETEALLREILPELPELVRVSPTVTALKERLAAGTALVCFQVQSVGLDEKKRLKALVELLGGRVPFMLLGTLPEGNLLFDLGSELKAAAVYDLGSRPGPFFQRLVLGILRRHGGSETAG